MKILFGPVGGDRRFGRWANRLTFLVDPKICLLPRPIRRGYDGLSSPVTVG